MLTVHKNQLEENIVAPIDRRIASRTRGQKHGPITRLMSPSDMGELMKPFVFLDLFDMAFNGSMPLHPHSGIGTVTVITRGDVRFDDVQSGTGTIGYGGVEWMRAGGGVWHGQEMSAGTSPSVQGFQLWLALPPEIENGMVDSQYVEAESMPTVGPAHVVLGNYQGACSPVRSPVGINYLLVTLKKGERWTYQPPAGHTLLWVSAAKGELSAGEPIRAGEMVTFENGEESITLVSTGSEEAIFVVGSGAPHPHPLALGYYSVHTNKNALQRGEAKIAEIRKRMLKEMADLPPGKSVPLFR